MAHQSTSDRPVWSAFSISTPLRSTRLVTLDAALPPFPQRRKNVGVYGTGDGHAVHMPFGAKPLPHESPTRAALHRFPRTLQENASRHALATDARTCLRKTALLARVK